MLLYLAGSLSPDVLEMCANRVMSPILDQPSPNFLFTFAHGDARKCAEHFCEQPHRRILIDSGAFTDWSKGNKIDRKTNEIQLGRYIAFCKRIQERAKCPVNFIALDIPLGEKGDKLEDLTPAVIERACEMGWDNYQTMKQEGIPCLPVFHQLENPEKWLKRFADDCDYLAVSPRKDLRPAIRHRWLKEMVFNRHVDPSKKIHGLGVSSTRWLKEFPFFSADNTDWQWPGKTKRYPVPNGKNWRVKDWENFFQGRVSAHTIKELFGYGETDPDGFQGGYWFASQAMQRDLRRQLQITEHWRKKGLVWDEESPWSRAYREVNSS
jgi:hypothetical protein